MIGRILDKYEILEEVGQGGMSVVYKGLDTSLQREVAVKVLHPHLASHEEARRRFEREAQAVAKLRHENILEIFDYSGKASAESYIVTEFIRGRTLKEFTTDHHLAFPEVGALITAEVCRALAHAHSLGVLHRDVKPENIMIRDDGCIKLMDFGIAQIIDTQRMTVTGQLLGSPAYMSPEHVEGRPLDFRTDVFSVGILLYQLATGELPFKGRNPHEILKRIAECKYLDPRVVNPLVGDRLGKIIETALARMPDDRFPDVASMLDDINRYLTEAELGEPRLELGRFFAQPVPYEQALRQRLIGALTKRGKLELEARRTNAALELFNRVLTMDPANEEVLREIDRLSRRRRVARGLMLALGLAVLVGGAAVAKAMWPEPDPPQRLVVTPAVVPDAAVVDPEADFPDAAVVALAPEPDAAVAAELPVDAGIVRVIKVEPRRHADAGVSVDVGPKRTIILRARYPKKITVRLGGTSYPIGGSPVPIEVPAGAHVLLASNDECCEPKEYAIAAADPDGKVIEISLVNRAATLIVKCLEAESITVDGAAVTSGKPVEHPIETNKTVTVVFTYKGGRPEERVKELKPGRQEIVECTGP